MTECMVCCDKYNNSTKKEIKCLFDNCNFSACKTCTRNYLLQTTLDPHCMSCKKTWPDNFLVNNLNKTFCEKEYKNHRKNLLTDREISKLPETMPEANKKKLIDTEYEKVKIIDKEIKNLNQLLRVQKDKKMLHYKKVHEIKNGSANASRNTFIMPCQNNDCNGFLSSQYKCNICELFTCPTCFEIIGHSKTDPHTCNPDNIATAEMIKKDTKPCPKCGVRIHKIQGCNQMWCTQCKVAFDYVTLKIDNGTIHNPHYYQHLQQENNGQAPRNPGDIICGGLCRVQLLNLYMLERLKERLNNQERYMIYYKYIMNVHRTMTHITYYELPRIRTNVRRYNDNEEFRIYYILGVKDGKKYTKDNLTSDVFRCDKMRKKNNDILNIYELISVVGIETFNLLIDPNNSLHNANYIKLVDEKIIELNNLKDYCNNELGKISITYNTSILYINNLWELKNKKYNLSEVKMSS